MTHQVKMHWLGPNYTRDGSDGNDVARTNIPDIRVQYRYETFSDELKQLFDALKNDDDVTRSEMINLLIK